jgi:hypothetical protein
MSSKKRRRMAHTRWSRNRPPGAAHTQKSFCENNAISESKYRELKRKGKGPREIELDNRIIITPEAEADWRREREAETMAKRQKAAASSRSAAPVEVSAT